MERCSRRNYLMGLSRGNSLGSIKAWISDKNKCGVESGDRSVRFSKKTYRK